MAEGAERLLVVDDDATVRDFLDHVLTEWGYRVGTAASGGEALRLYPRGFDLVLVDMAMPRVGGAEIVRRLKGLDPAVMAIAITGFGSVESALEALKAGAFDYLTKPFDLEHLKIAVEKALTVRRQALRLSLLEEQSIRGPSFHGLVGVSRPMQRVYEFVRQVAETDTTVLVQGETGTGKELVARAIHSLSPRRDRGLLPVNCGALSEAVLESELFGHEQGAFTGALHRRLGLLELVGGGTLFLDEIGEMSPGLQVRLLRAIQEREVLRVGGDRPVPVDFRLIAAANGDVRQAVEEGRFRRDLFYRLSVAVVDLPPLRARRADIPLLALHFMACSAERTERPVEDITPEAMMLLQAYDWPGNVRELENAIEQAVLFCHQKVLSPADLPIEVKSAGPPVAAPADGDPWGLPLREARVVFERHYLKGLLERAGGVVAEAARLAGIRRQYFYKRMKQLDLPLRDETADA